MKKYSINRFYKLEKTFIRLYIGLYIRSDQYI